MKVLTVCSETDIRVMLTAMVASPSIASFIDEIFELELVTLGYWDDDEMQVIDAGHRFLATV